MELRPLERTEVPFPSTGRVYVTRCEGGCPLQFPLDEIVPEVEDAIQRGLQMATIALHSSWGAISGCCKLQ